MRRLPNRFLALLLITASLLALDLRGARLSWADTTREITLTNCTLSAGNLTCAIEFTTPPGSSSGVIVSGTINLLGTWDGATAQVQFSSDGTHWDNATGKSCTADCTNLAFIDELNRSERYWQVVISGGGGSESIALTGSAKVHLWY